MARVLIVDDNPFIVEFLRTMLQDLGHEVVADAQDSAGAVEKFTALRPDIVALDIMLPVESGIECLKKILALDPRARVFIITALGQSSVEKQVSGLGALFILNKPFDREEVALAVAACLRAAR